MPMHPQRGTVPALKVKAQKAQKVKARQKAVLDTKKGGVQRGK